VTTSTRWHFAFRTVLS